MNNRTSTGVAGANRSPARLLIRLLGVAVCSYIGLIVLLTLLETSMIYPAPDPKAANWAPGDIEFEDAQFASSDGTALHGWYLAHPDPRGVLLFCHGNGEHVAWLGAELELLRDAYGLSVLAFDYRGYGKSGGRPAEQGILEDAKAARQWLARRSNVDEANVIVWGRSLGGAVAVSLAADGGARGLVLDRTFSSLVDVASAIFPWLPVRTLLRNRYPSDERITRYAGPLIQVHGKPDEVIPYRFGRALFDASPSTQKRFIASDTLGHNDRWPQEYYVEIKAFLDALP